MPEFIKVLGDDPHYPTRRAPLFVNLTYISKIFPEWAEEREGTLYRCSHEHPKAKVVGYTLVDSQGNKYSCNKEEFDRVGVELEPRRGPLGFAIREDKQAPST